ncbi:hypothetical protein [Candidatus Methylomirabilis sp.]|uniref:hypothetical protein n=1 Tax=Candidatus Methylomirabilis sp. TaxID=2032687 RepID=UPI002A636338|nr:hypothetical protein [Candidatus Methylomirabilis sp.]
MKRVKYLATITAILTLTALGGATPGLAAEEQVATSKAAENAQGTTPLIRTISGTVTAVVPDAKTLVVTVPRGTTDALVVGARVTDQTVMKEGTAKKRLEELNVGDRVWMKFERVSDGDIAQVIVIKRGRQRD